LLQILHASFEFGSAMQPNLLDILHANFEFGTAIAAPTCYKFGMQALSFALQLQRQFV
jgi:hypothetical protein